jgi:GTP-binding protein
MADIPGLIEGASQGAGLGFRFLKHLSRTRHLLHLIDVLPADNSDPVYNATTIIAELEKFSATLADKERWLVLNKVDLLSEEQSQELESSLREALNWQGEIYRVSALSGDGCERLMNDLMDSIAEHRSKLLEDEEYREAQKALEETMAFEIRRSIEASKPARRKKQEFDDEEDWDDWDE